VKTIYQLFNQIESQTASPLTINEEENKEIKEYNNLEMQKFFKPSYYEFAINCVKHNIPLYLYGPAGTGKTTIARNIAKDLNLSFYPQQVLDPFILLGYKDANGKYQETEFYKFCVNGGLFFLDEMDASDSNALIILNSAIANNEVSFPCGIIKLNENCRYISAGNTIGTGANETYTGRNRLDAACLDRWAKILIEYDRQIELELTHNLSLVNFIDDFTHACKTAGIIGKVVSYRALQFISIMSKFEKDLKNILKATILADLSKEDIESIKNNMLIKENGYYKLL